MSFGTTRSIAAACKTVDLIRGASMRNGVIVAALVGCCVALSAHAKDDLLETLAQKGVLTPEEYQKLKDQRKSELTFSAEDGLRISSADGNNSVQVGTLQQLDFANYDEDGTDLSDGSELRRSRLAVSGVFLKDWQYRVEYEFAGTTSVTDAYVAYTALKPLTITLGQFKQPFGMEALASDKNVTFMERGLPFYFITTRAPGAMVGTSGANWSVNGGFFGEPINNAQAGDEGYGAVARVSYAPWMEANRVVHFGLAGLWRKPTDENSSNTTGPKFETVRFRAKPESNILAQRFVDTGEIRAVDTYSLLGLEAAAQAGAASLQAEYHLVQVKRDSASTLDFSGWYAQAAYTLTGEARPYRGDRGFFDGIRPARAFGKDGWGAFEVAARMSEIDLTDRDIVGGRERNATVAFNWYLNPILKFSANVVKVLDIDDGPFDGQEPTAYQIRLQVAL
ncbi:MAG: porin [Steroidobacteraceae bacterium]